MFNIIQLYKIIINAIGVLDNSPNNYITNHNTQSPK
jgi:hypothetical protein